MADNIIIAQLNSHALNVEKNALKACEIIKNAQNQNASAVIFPEMFLTGYPVGNVFQRFPILAQDNLQWLEALAKITQNLKVIIGFLEKDNEKFYNSLAVLSNGKIEKIFRKSNLISGEIIDKFEIFEIKNKKFALINCETGFNEKNFDLSKADEIASFVKTNKIDYLLNCSASISRTNKEYFKNILLKNIAQKCCKPLIYVNSIGANEALSFDGMSRIYNEKGEITARAKAFEEQILTVDLQKEQNEINSAPFDINQPTNLTDFSLNYENDLKRTYLSVVQAIKDYFQKTGFKRAVLGLSGGLDSTVSAVLLIDALGKENVFAISMPSSITTSDSKNDAQILAKNLGIGFTQIPIKDMFDASSKTFNTTFKEVEKIFDCRYKKSFTNDNIQARSRAMILWGVANEFEACLPIATSDKSEAYMGYATINGDMSGGFAPLADITKTKLFALATWMNENREQKNVIPQSIIDKRPGAELAINPKTNKPLLAEEALMPYEFLDEVIWRIENKNQTLSDMIEDEFLYEKKEKISKKQKEEWLNKFFKRMSTAHYKWSIMPTIPIVDSFSINSCEYFQPIVSSKMNYVKTSVDEKIKKMNL